MPTDAEHLEKYRENVALLNAGGGLAALSEPWASVVAFYAAVHLVERLAAQVGLHHTSHGGRSPQQWGRNSRHLFVNSHHPQILADYMSLFLAGHIARYDSAGTFSAAFPPGTVQAQLIGNCLAALENYVFAAIPPPPGPTPAAPPPVGP
jgi:hypothetical protein